MSRLSALCFALWCSGSLGLLPFIAMAVGKMPVRSCLIDGEAIVCGEKGLAVFDAQMPIFLARSAIVPTMFCRRIVLMWPSVVVIIMLWRGPLAGPRIDFGFLLRIFLGGLFFAPGVRRRG